MMGRTGVGGGRMRWVVWGGAAALLALPWVAMQTGDTVTWDAADFVLFGALLAGGCIAWEVAMRTIGRPAFRAVAVVGIVAVVGLVWLNLAVGIFGPG